MSKLARIAKFIPFHSELVAHSAVLRTTPSKIGRAKSIASKTLLLLRQNCTRAQPCLRQAGRTALLFLLLVGGYYLLFLGPQIRHSRALSEVEGVIGEHAFNLVQNRIAFVELTKLDPKTGNFNFEKSELVGTLQKTGKEGLEQQEVKLPKINPQLQERFPALIAETKAVYQKQDELLKKVFATSSYAAGLTIMKSPEAVGLLTKQTNLILEYQFWLEEIN